MKKLFCGVLLLLAVLSSAQALAGRAGYCKVTSWHPFNVECNTD